MKAAPGHRAATLAHMAGQTASLATQASALLERSLDDEQLNPNQLAGATMAAIDSLEAALVVARALVALHRARED